jgi:hypothetical protein
VEDHFAARLSDAPQALFPLFVFSRRLPQHRRNPFNNGIDIAHHFEVPESQHPTSIRPKERAAAFVLPFLLRVLRTIDFNNQGRFKAYEVDEVGANWVLPAELETIELPLAQPRPQLLFGFCGARAQMASCIAWKCRLVSHVRIVGRIAARQTNRAA